LIPTDWCAADGAGSPRPLTAHTLSLSLQEADRGILQLVLKDPSARDCSRLQVEKASAPGQLDMKVMSEPPRDNCPMMEPPPASATVPLPPEPGAWRLSLTTALGTDKFALSYSSAAVTFKPEGATRVSQAERTGEFLLVPPHSLWIELSSLGPGARERLQARGRVFFEGLRRLGAREFVPTPGRYLSKQRMWLALDPDGGRKNPTDPTERRYFLYEGDFAAVQKLVERFSRQDHPRGSTDDTMSLFIGGWNGERLNSKPN